ncbi:MAG: DNA topology modulation protein FlaR, partial [Eubacterium sp.]|nr:DNA topology modulation protein FlaR [Eubacterium sp.]
MKIAVLGFSGSGKSTLAKQLSEYYAIPLLYLDCVNFEKNWVLRDRDECRKMVAEFMQNESWVIDGNYSEMYQAERLEQADKIIILRYNRFVCMKGAFKRNIEYKGRVRESMADGCTERMD